MTSLYSLPAVLEPRLSGREAVVDAMYRVAAAFDTNDVALLDSAMTPDSILEINGRPLTGRAEIHAHGLSIIFSVDTTHMVTNVRVHVKDEAQTKASLTATVLSQHFAKDKGLEPGQENLLGGSLYRGDLVRDVDGLWKFEHLWAKATWIQGDWSVIGGEFSKSV